MYTEFDEFDKSPKGKSFDELWGASSDSTVVDVSGMVKEADFSGNSVEKAIQDRTYVGSQLPSETLEVRRHIKVLMDEGCEYPVLEAALKKQGYAIRLIRQQFQEVTGIDPVVAYMDMENYSKPPPEVPRYNYGWGEAKKAKGTYCFVLPFVQHYAVWKQAGFVRTVESEHVTLTEARAALKKVVTEPKDIMPEISVAMVNPLIRIASLSEAAKDVLGEAQAFNSTVTLQHKKAFVTDRVIEGFISEGEAETINEILDPVQKTAADGSPTDDFDTYREQMEGNTLDNATEKLKVPQKGFDERLQTSHQVTTLQMAQKAFKKLEEMSQYVQGYTLKPVGHQVDLKDVEFAAEEGQERIDSGSVSLIVEIQDQRGNQKAEALLIMFIVSGELLWGGTLKGSNNKEYALSQAGIDTYFQDLSGSSLANPTEVLPSGTMDQNQLSPDVAPLRY